MTSQSEKWDRGEFTYSKEEKELMKLEGGQRIGDILNRCTICPVGNATCVNYFKIVIAGYHPEKKMKRTEIMVCSLGVTNMNHCPLSK